MEITNEKLLEGARNLKRKGFSPQQVDDWLKTKGSSLDAMRGFVKQQKQPKTELTPLTEEQKAKPKGNYWDGAIEEGVKGFGKGVLSGVGSALSGATLGATDWIDRKTGGNLAKLKQELQASAEAEGLGGVNQIANALSEMGGNVAGAGKVIAGKVGKGLGGVVLGSGLEGLGYGVTSSDNLEELPSKALFGATLGGVTSGGVYGTGKALGTAWDIAKPYARASQRAIDDVANEIGVGKLKELVNTARQKGRSVLEVGDADIVDMMQGARQNSKQAFKNIDKAYDDFVDSQATRNNNIVNDVFGSKNKYQNTDDVIRLAKEQAQPIYDKLQNIGDLSVVNGKIKGSIEKNPYIKTELANIRKNPLYQVEYNVSNLPDTDWRMLDQVNRNINDQISTAVRAGESEKVRLLERQKHNLLNMVDDIVPEYKTARGIYEAENKALKAQKIGENTILDGNTTADKLRRSMQDMSDYEKQSLKIGAREKIINTIESKENQALGLKKLNNAQTRDKLRTLLGNEGDRLIDYAEDEVKAMRNLNKLTGNSNTAEKLSKKQRLELALKTGRNPVGVVGETAESSINRLDNASNDVLSQLLLEKGGAGLNKALNDYAERLTKAEQLKRLLTSGGGVTSNQLLNIE
jgi:hypothetical protein